MKTLDTLAEKIGLKHICGELDKEICGCYAGDLLSWVMSHAQYGDVWITIMSNQNVAAVAVLSDVSCVIFADGVKPDPDLLKKAELQKINLLATENSAFRMAAEMGGVL